MYPMHANSFHLYHFFPGDPEYQRAFTVLDEINLAFLKPFFKKHELQVTSNIKRSFRVTLNTFVSGNIEIRGKQNSLFPEEAVIK